MRAASLDDLPDAPPETFRQRLTYWQYRAVWEAAAHLPASAAAWLPDRLGPLWYRWAPERQRAIVRRNLARVAGHPPPAELDALVRRAYASYVRYWLDAFRLHRMSAEDVLARSADENLVVIDDMLAGGDGGILATAHLGSWDIGAFFTAQRNWGMTVVAEVLQPRRLFERFVALRQQAGIDVIPLVRGGDMVARLAGAVRRGGLATLLADRDLGRRGPIVEFFGEPCRLPGGAAVLARRTGRPVAVGAFVTEGAGYRGVVVGEALQIAHLDVQEGTQAIARSLETLIGRYPEQWHVFVRNWLADREPDHPAVTGG